MHRLLFLICLLISPNVCAQNDTLNRDKYWILRARFLEKFIKTGPGHGESVPASTYFIAADNPSDPSSAIYKKLDWGADATMHLGWYMGVLSTEIKLLRDQGLPFDSTARELYYAQMAFDRLDDYAEMLWGYSNDNDCRVDFPSGEPATWDTLTQHWLPKPGSPWQDTVRNGFFLRMDGPPGFMKYFPDADIINVVLTRPWDTLHNQLADTRLVPHDLGYRTIGYWRSNEASQDQVFNLLMGLMLTVEFCGDAAYNEIVLKDKAREIALRILDFYSPSWTFQNPVTNNLCNGGGDSWAFAASLKKIRKYFGTGEKSDKRRQIYLWGASTSDCSRAEKHYQVNRHLFAITSALANSTPHLAMCRYVSRNGFDWGFYYLLRKALYPHEAAKGCDYTAEDVRNDLNLCPARGPHWDQYLYTSDGTYKTNGRFTYNTGDPNDSLYKPQKWFFSNRYVKTCANNEERGEFNGLDYMLLYNLYKIVYSDDLPYRNAE